MITKLCLVHYHEIGLKGKNRSRFEERLIKNLKFLLREFPGLKVNKISGYIVVSAHPDVDFDALIYAIKQIPGVARASECYRCGLDENEYINCSVRVLKEWGSFSTFKVHARRSSTDYQLHSLDINRLVGSALCEAFPDKKVDVHNPDCTVNVHVVQGWVFVYAKSMPGAGGLPVGSAGKVVSLLSSGIDSPVATWMVGRRGAVCIGVHFSGRPMTSDSSEWLAQDICKALAPSGVIGRLYVVPFGTCQREISLAVDQKLRIIMYRRLMVEISQRIAHIEGAKALVTGESLGQVASQTLENILAVDEIASIPIFRPLIGSDKQEIIKQAHAIKTFDISSQTTSDCCTLFMPRSPETHARLDEVHTAWESFDHNGMADELMNTIEWKDLDCCPSYFAPKGAFNEHHDVLKGL